MHLIPWNLTQSVPPAGFLVVDDDVKPHLRILHADEDTLLADYTKAAERAVEAELGIALLSQTLVLRLDRFPAWEIKLPSPPLTSITSITYTDTDGVSQTRIASLYTADIYTTPGSVQPAYGESWPSTRNVPNAVVITYVAGYATAGDVPAMIKSAILLTIGVLYENREKDLDSPIVLRQLPIYDNLVTNHRTYWQASYR